MSEVEVFVLLYEDGVQTYVSRERAVHIPSDPQTADLIAADVLRAARRVVAAVEEKYQK